jgi:hypothetical protein
MQSYDPRERAVEAVRILNQFIGDFTVGTRGLEIYEWPSIAAQVSPRIREGLNRMAISYLVISLAKLEEFYRRYRAILPDDVVDACRSLHHKVIDRGIVDFRNKVVGHIVDDDTNRPLTYSEIDQRLDRVLNGSLDDFLLWINNPAENTFPNSVVAITEHVRDRLQHQYRIGAEETVES